MVTRGIKMDVNYEPLANVTLKKSNQMVSAKYTSTLVENQITAIAMARIEVNAKNTSENAVMEAKLYPGDLRRLLGNTTHIYRTLKTVAKTMPGHTMFLEDGMGNFKSFAIVTNADYENGIFKIKFNSELKNHLFLGTNFTPLELSVLTEFKRNSSFRLYELLKREVYRSNPNINNGRVEVEYRLSEFRFMIGLADADSKNITTEIRKSHGSLDWDVLYERLDEKERKYESWGELQRRIIRPAQVELKEKSNIYFEYEGIREGKKVTRILFGIYPNKPKAVTKLKEKQKLLETEPYRQMEIPMDIYAGLYDEFVGHNELIKEDIDKLLEYANYDEALVRDCIKMADNAKNVNNYMGWIISAIRREFSEPICVEEGSVEKAVISKTIQEDNMDKSLQERVWKKTTEKEDFDDFLTSVGFDLATIDTIYDDPKEKVQMYTEWKIQNMKKG